MRIMEFNVSGECYYMVILLVTEDESHAAGFSLRMRSQIDRKMEKTAEALPRSSTPARSSLDESVAPERFEVQ
jgi:hypothetical protein